jgi:hydrogenase maturation factor
MSLRETTRGAAGQVPRCEDPDHCITCSDEGVPMHVVSCNAEAGLAWCVDDAGVGAEVMTALVDPVTVGDVLLVHAGTALTRLERVA